MAEIETINGNPIVAEVASESIQPSVDAWLAAHPEVTTTVQDGSVTDAKLVQTGGVIDAVKRLDNRIYGISDDTPPLELFEKGSLNNGVNDTWRANARARSKGILRFDTPALVAVKTGSYLLAYFDANDAYTSSTSWNNSSAAPIYIPAGQGFRILMTPNINAGGSDNYSLAECLSNFILVVDAAHECTKNVFDMSFQHGSLNDGIDDVYRGAARVRSIGISKMPVSVNVSMSSGSYGVHLFDDNNVFESFIGWNTTDKTLIPAGQKFRLVISNDLASQAITSTESIVANLVIEPVAHAPIAVPNIIFQCRNVDDTRIPPESIWAVKAAANNQYDRVRFTVRKTLDGYYFNCHNDTINAYVRNMDGTELSSTVYANGRTLAELNAYDWGIKYGSQYAGARVPMLEDTLKYAAIFNLGVTWHAASTDVETDASIEEQLAMLDKYGLTDNLLVITSANNNIAVMRKFVEHNPRVSCYCGANDDWYTAANIAALKSLQTPYNKIYVQDMPWGTETSDEFLEMAKTNNFCLLSSNAMDKASLLNVEKFAHGYTFIEANNVYMIKDTLASWANSLI